MSGVFKVHVQVGVRRMLESFPANKDLQSIAANRPKGCKEFAHLAECEPIAPRSTATSRSACALTEVNDTQHLHALRKCKTSHTLLTDGLVPKNEIELILTAGPNISQRTANAANHLEDWNAPQLVICKFDSGRLHKVIPLWGLTNSPQQILALALHPVSGTQCLFIR